MNQVTRIASFVATVEQRPAHPWAELLRAFGYRVVREVSHYGSASPVSVTVRRSAIVVQGEAFHVVERDIVLSSGVAVLLFLFFNL